MDHKRFVGQLQEMTQALVVFTRTLATLSPQINPGGEIILPAAVIDILVQHEIEHIRKMSLDLQALTTEAPPENP